MRVRGGGRGGGKFKMSGFALFSQEGWERWEIWERWERMRN
jgi:hypothetical protein